MKMVTIPSLCPYDAAARCALELVSLRQPAILPYASWAGDWPIFAGWSDYPFDGGLPINPGIDVMYL